MRNPEIFNIKESKNIYGNDKEIILCNPDEEDDISNSVKEVLDFVIETTKNLYWSDFIKLVYSTYPIFSQSKYTILDLPDLAKKYKHMQLQDA